MIARFTIAVEDAEAQARRRAAADRRRRRRPTVNGSRMRCGARHARLPAARVRAPAAACRGSGISSRAQFDQAQHALDVARQGLTARAAGRQRAGDLGGDPQLPIDSRPAVREAPGRARSRQAGSVLYRDTRARSTASSPRSSNCRSATTSTPRRRCLRLVSQRDVWVEANFKEDELTYMRPGQSGEVRDRRVSGHDLQGTVQSPSPGTGAQFSLLPPENATGNWVKVVQRVPVRTLDRRRQADRAARRGHERRWPVDTEHHRSLFGHSGRHAGRGAGGRVSRLGRRAEPSVRRAEPQFVPRANRGSSPSR